MTLSSRLHTLTDTLTETCEAIHRDPKEITLIAVTKKQSAQTIRELHQLGPTHIAENYLQEALEKKAELTDLPLTWHFIGKVQSNKTRSIACEFDWLQSLESVKIAERLARDRPAHLAPLNVCIQVNIDDDPSKSGVTPNEVMPLAQVVLAYPKQLHLRGLMAIPQATRDREVTRTSFQAMRGLFDSLKAQGLPLDTLSMGMSQDFKIAIECGATMLRIGTALLGERAR